MTKTQDTSTLNEHTATRMAELLRGFGDTSRVRVLAALLDQGLNVGALASRPGVTESAISHRLRRLRQMRLVKARRDVQKVCYRTEESTLWPSCSRGSGTERTLDLSRVGAGWGQAAGPGGCRALRERKEATALMIEVVKRCTSS